MVQQNQYGKKWNETHQFLHYDDDISVVGRRYHTEKHRTSRLRVFENWFLRRIFIPKTDAVPGEWRILHSKELHNLYSSPNSLGRANQG
jgi:uncharacterized membrane protein